MKLHVIETGFFKLDGGAMFGVVPKSIWQRLNPADENNLCSWSMRCLLVEDGKHLTLIDNGLGTKQDSKFFGYYHLHGTDSLHHSIHKAGFSEQDVTDMFMTHLHFDHCGGGVYLEEGKPRLTFPRARYWSNAAHWKWATEPNARERASFLRENIIPISDSGQLSFVDPDATFERFGVFYASGHTEQMMIPTIRYKNRTICYMADLLPSVGHIPTQYLMSYDIRPLLSMEEKERFLEQAADNDYVLFLEHDPRHECCTVQRTDKGIRLKDTFKLSDI